MIELPTELRISTDAAPLEAGGRRAHAVERDGALVITIDGRAVTLELDPPLPAAAAEQWPFGARASGDTIAAASDQPVVVLEREARGAPLRIRRSGGIGITVIVNDMALRDGWLVADTLRVVVQGADAAGAVAADLVAGAIARARKREATRPRASLPGVAVDPIAGGDQRLRLDIAGRDVLGARTVTLSVLALLAVNDAKAARSLIGTHAAVISDDPVSAVAIAGAWSAWRGEALGEEPVRAAARAWTYAEGDDPWGAVARALEPYAADVIAERPTAPSKSAPDAASAIAQLARSAHEAPGACALLRVLHGDLGIMPDASRARVRIAPALTAGSTRVDRLAIADAVLYMHAEVADEHATIVVEQTHGATPYTAIVEPWLPGRRLSGALIEDTAATLDSAEEAGGIRPRVQLIIDRSRRVVLHFERR